MNLLCTTERGNIMNVTHQALTTALTTAFTAAVVGIFFVPAASACGPNLQSPFAIAQLMLNPQIPLEPVTSASLARELSDASSGNIPSIIGMWSFQFISMGNTTHNPSIPDGTQLDFGYNQWHSDGTEVLNSGGRSPAQGNFCLGVWQKTGASTYQLNHFALNYDATTGTWLGKISVVETVTLSPGGTAYSGTFVYTVFDTKGNKTDHLTGQVTAQRVTVDTTTP
jgi:hypothetical protein